jgi:CheY-like chemotaxis protein
MSGGGLATRPESWHGYCGPPLVAMILVIDDYPPVRELFADVLMSAGHDVITASDGSMGLALYAQHHPALVITDLQLPGLPGLAVVERLSQEPGLKIIAVSGTGLDDLERAQQLGAAVTLTKPFQITELLAAVRQLVGEQPPSVN